MLGFIKKFRIDFIVIGVQKSGTSALDYYLRNHPQIGMAKIKELHYFDNESEFKSNNPRYSNYHKFFDIGNNDIYGEVTPSYIYWNKSIQRIHKYSKNIKLIAILRNPVERAYSHWNMSVNKNNEKRDFTASIMEEIALINKNNQIQNLPFSYVDRGLYSLQINRIFSYFTEDQLLFLKYEDFLQEQEKYMNKIFSFLGVKTSLFKFEFKEHHKIDYLEYISETDRKMLINFYYNDIKKMEKLLNWNCKDWLN